MDSVHLPWGRFLSANPAVPTPIETPRPSVEPLSPRPPRKPKRRIWLLLGAAVLVAAAFLAWNQRSVFTAASQRPVGSTIPTAKAYVGDFERVLRTSGTISARNFAAIRTPTMRGGRDAGRSSSSLTLMSLAEPGTTVEAGEGVAEFEYRWLEDHLDDRRSTLAQSESDVEKKRAEIMIAKETEQQALRTARAERDKALLDLRTEEVRSEIEAEILKLAAEEAEAALKQLEEEVRLQEIAHDAELRSQELLVEKDRLHVERHERDLEKIKTTTPVRGLVVLESIYRGGGQFDQVQTGDEVNPGTFFMRVVDLSEMIVTGAVSQVDSQSIRIGQKAEVRLDAYPDLALPGRVVSIGAMATSGGGGGWRRGGRDDYVKTVGVEIAIDAEDPRVIPDLSASADILIDRQQDQLLVPRSAILRKGDQTFVQVRSADAFVEREVELGAANATHAVIQAGLQEGDEVSLRTAG